jgi:hypothetical protein
MKEKPKVIPRGPDRESSESPDHMQSRDDAYQSGESSDRLGVANPEQFLAEQAARHNQNKRKNPKKKK